jgi:hypothetical protein
VNDKTTVPTLPALERSIFFQALVGKRGMDWIRRALSHRAGTIELYHDLSCLDPTGVKTTVWISRFMVCHLPFAICIYISFVHFTFLFNHAAANHVGIQISALLSIAGGCSLSSVQLCYPRELLQTVVASCSTAIASRTSIYRIVPSACIASRSPSKRCPRGQGESGPLAF